MLKKLLLAAGFFFFFASPVFADDPTRLIGATGTESFFTGIVNNTNSYCFQETSVASGTMDQVKIYSWPNAGLTEWSLAIYADDSNVPGTLLNQVRFAPTISEWGMYSFPSTSIAVDTKYWLCAWPSDPNQVFPEFLYQGAPTLLFNGAETDGSYSNPFITADPYGINGSTNYHPMMGGYDSGAPSDPVTVTFNSTADSFVRNGNDNRNEGGEQFMRIQSSGSNRALVRFDQSALQSSVSGTLLSAKLRLTITDNANNWGSTGRTVDVHSLVANWAEGNGTENSRGTGIGATWNCAFDSAIQNQAKDCSGSTEWEMGQPNNSLVHPWTQTPSDTKTISNNQGGVVEYDVTSDVLSFLNGSKNNYGWIVKKTEEGQNGQVSFGTKESTSVPQLVVTFQP